MSARTIDDRRLIALARRHGTPLFVYDGRTIDARFRELAGFDRVRYAQKANGNLALLARLRALGAHVDAVSAGEIARALAAGFEPERIVYTADLFASEALELVARHRLHVNCGSTTMLDELRARAGPCEITLRVNPGFGDGHHGKVTTGGERSKHGIWRDEVGSTLERARELGHRVAGLHVHVGSGAREDELARAAAALVELAPRVGATLRTISVGGGLTIPYRASDPVFDTRRYAATCRAMVARLRRAIELEVEPGRFLVAQSGYLLAEVRAIKRNRELAFALIDAGFDDLIRPALYGAHHEIDVLDAADRERAPWIVAGPLCESADVFTLGPDGEPAPRALPIPRVGDVVCIQDAGAYAMSMASNYNARPFPAEVLVDGDDERLIRRRQTLDELSAFERGLGSIERGPWPAAAAAKPSENR